MGGTGLTPPDPRNSDDTSPPDGATTRDLPDGERLFRVLFEQAAVGVGLLDTRTGLILRVNRKYQEIVGYTEGELVGLDFMRITYPEDLPGDLARMERLTAGDIREFSMEKRLLRRDGTPVWVELTVSPMWSPGEPPSQHIAVVVDITARRAAEEQQRSLEAQLRQAQKMEALGTLAGGVAHDFNNLLAMVGLNTQLIRSRLPADHPVREQLDTMDTVVHRGARLIQQILAFSRKQPASRTVIPVNDAVLEAANMLRAMLPAGVDIAVTTDATAPGVLADATQLQQVLINLGMNAWQAIERGIGGIRFSVATVSSCAERTSLLAEDHVQIRVEDDGVGMTPATLERIFEPFFTTKGPGKGSGLGLSVVHGIVEEHGGLIRVQSNPGQGSIFDVFLPLRRPSAAAAVEIAPMIRGNGARVFYVDDEPSLLRPVLGILGLLGYRSTGFSSPTVALEQLRADPHAVDLLITDLGMPGLSGLDLARQVSAVRPDLPIVLASGYAPLSDEELLAAGIRGRLPKPFNLRQLSEALSAHLPAPAAGPGGA